MLVLWLKMSRRNVVAGIAQRYRSFHSVVSLPLAPVVAVQWLWAYWESGPGVAKLGYTWFGLRESCLRGSQPVPYVSELPLAALC